MEKLTDEQETELIEWIETFELSRPSKRLGRDFSDGGKNLYSFKSLSIKIFS